MNRTIKQSLQVGDVRLSSLLLCSLSTIGMLFTLCWLAVKLFGPF